MHGLHLIWINLQIHPSKCLNLQNRSTMETLQINSISHLLWSTDSVKTVNYVSFSYAGLRLCIISSNKKLLLERNVYICIHINYLQSNNNHSDSVSGHLSTLNPIFTLFNTYLLTVSAIKLVLWIFSPKTAACCDRKQCYESTFRVPCGVSKKQNSYACIQYFSPGCIVPPLTLRLWSTFPSW